VIEQIRMPRQAARAVQDRMRTLLRIVLYLVLVAVVALLGIAIFSDLPAPQREVEVPIEPK
jgi:hypothetical protein